CQLRLPNNTTLPFVRKDELQGLVRLLKPVSLPPWTSTAVPVFLTGSQINSLDAVHVTQSSVAIPGFQTGSQLLLGSQPQNGDVKTPVAQHARAWRTIYYLTIMNNSNTYLRLKRFGPIATACYAVSHIAKDPQTSSLTSSILQKSPLNDGTLPLLQSQGTDLLTPPTQEPIVPISNAMSMATIKDSYDMATQTEPWSDEVGPVLATPETELMPTRTCAQLGIKLDLHQEDQHYTSQLQSLLQANHDVFATSTDEIKGSTLPPVDIRLREGADVSKLKRARVFPQSLENQAEIERQLADFQRQNIIQRSNSPYLSNAFLVSKKDKSKRHVVDYRGINPLLELNINLTPTVPEVVRKLAAARPVYYT